MVSYDLELTLLVFFLILLIILKLIFAFGKKGDDKAKPEKTKEVVVSKSVSEKDSYGVAKVKEQPTTYIINGASDKSNYSNSGSINSDAYLGNYMQDVLVLNEPIPNKMVFENNNNPKPSENEKPLVDSKKSIYSLDNKIDDLINQPTDSFNNEMFEELVELDAKKSPNSSFMKEYRGLSREMKIYLISKILDKRVNH